MSDGVRIVRIYKGAEVGPVLLNVKHSQFLSGGVDKTIGCISVLLAKKAVIVDPNEFQVRSGKDCLVRLQYELGTEQGIKTFADGLEALAATIREKAGIE